MRQKLSIAGEKQPTNRLLSTFIGVEHNELMQAMEGINENKAVWGILKPKLLRLGQGRTEEIIYRIIK